MYIAVSRNYAAVLSFKQSTKWSDTGKALHKFTLQLEARHQKEGNFRWEWWCSPIISVLWKQEDHKFNPRLGNLVI